MSTRNPIPVSQTCGCASGSKDGRDQIVDTQSRHDQCESTRISVPGSAPMTQEPAKFSRTAGSTHCARKTKPARLRRLRLLKPLAGRPIGLGGEEIPFRRSGASQGSSGTERLGVEWGTHKMGIANTATSALSSGGDVAKRLMDLYDVTRSKILEANSKSSREIVDWLSGVLCSIREAWQQVKRQNPAIPAAEDARRASPAPVAPAPSESDGLQLQRNA
jgi:Flagellar protein FliS